MTNNFSKRIYPKRMVPHLPHCLFWKGSEFYWILLFDLWLAVFDHEFLMICEKWIWRKGYVNVTNNFSKRIYPKKKVPHLLHSLFWKGTEFYWILLLWFMTSLFSMPLRPWSFNDLRKWIWGKGDVCVTNNLSMRYPKKEVPHLPHILFRKKPNFIGFFSFDLWLRCFHTFNLYFLFQLTETYYFSYNNAS